jgi:hypothetical protein
MRLALAGLLTAGGLTAALSLGWIGLLPAPGSVAEESPWQVRELAFLKAAYDRTQHDIDNQTEASASLYGEQQRILREMAETAKLLPAEAIPAELHALLRDAGTAPIPLSRLIETIEADERPSTAAVRRPPDLRVGLRLATGGGSSSVAEVAEFATDPELREPIQPAPAASRPASRRKPRDNAGRGQ